MSRDARSTIGERHRFALCLARDVRREIDEWCTLPMRASRRRHRARHRVSRPRIVHANRSRDDAVAEPLHAQGRRHFAASTIRASWTRTVMSSHAQPHPRQVACSTALSCESAGRRRGTWETEMLSGRWPNPALHAANSLGIRRLDLMGRYLHINRHAAEGWNPRPSRTGDLHRGGGTASARAPRNFTAT